MFWKSAILLCCSVVIRVMAVGQTVEDLDSMVVVYFNEGAFAKALPFAEKSLEIINNNGKEKHPEYLNAVNNLAIIYKKLGNYSKAEPLYKVVAEIKKQ